MDIDQTIRDLFRKLETRKAKISEHKAQMQGSWKTTGAWRRLGTSTSTTNIQTANFESIVDIAMEVVMLDNARKEVEQRLGVQTQNTIQGYSVDVWFADFSKRLATIQVRDEEAELAKLEARLNQVLSPEDRRRIEVELLSKEI